MPTANLKDGKFAKSPISARTIVSKSMPRVHEGPPLILSSLNSPSQNFSDLDSSPEGIMANAERIFEKIFAKKFNQIRTNK